MFIIRHIVIRNNKQKQVRKIVFIDRLDAVKYIYGLRSHETLLLFKEEQRVEERRN